MLLTLFATLLTLLCRTLRIETRNEAPIESYPENKNSFVVVFWHGSMLLPWWWLRNKNCAALVSQSKDGDVLARLLQKWNYHLVRGSSSRGGKEAMVAMEDLITRGYTLCVTPDGPHGPGGEMKMGAIRAAQKTGVPIVPVAVKVGWKKILKSWDRFIIPLPFAKCIVACGDPIVINPQLDGDTLEQMRVRIENQLHELTQQIH